MSKRIVIFDEAYRLLKEAQGQRIEDGWKVVRFWEHEINGNPEYCRETLAKALGGLP